MMLRLLPLDAVVSSFEPAATRTQFLLSPGVGDSSGGRFPCFCFILSGGHVKAKYKHVTTLFSQETDITCPFLTVSR